MIPLAPLVSERAVLIESCGRQISDGPIIYEVDAYYYLLVELNTVTGPITRNGTLVASDPPARRQSHADWLFPERGRFPRVGVVAAAVVFGLVPALDAGAEERRTARYEVGRPDGADKPVASRPEIPISHREVPDDPWMPRPAGAPAGVAGRCEPWVRGSYVSVQVNVDANGCNIIGDAANEPSIAVDPTDPNRIVIGWRQFDTVESNFRQAGWAYSHDAGQTWTFPGVLEPGVFRSDPVLDFDADGNFYYLSLRSEANFNFFFCDLWKSTDGGVSWDAPVYAYGGDKAWFAIDKTAGAGLGNVYAFWSYSYGCSDCGERSFTRSTDGGASFMTPMFLPGPLWWKPSGPIWGTVAIGPEGELYLSGRNGRVVNSLNAKDPGAEPTFTYLGDIDLGGTNGGWAGPNPEGLLGQTWIACDHSDGPTRGNVYLLSSVEPDDGGDPLDVMLARSTDGGDTWSPPVRVNDDPPDNNAWQWFGTMSVSPHGRIDVIFNDTRNTGQTRLSELFYTSSVDGGQTWSANVPVSPVFDSWIGWPRQNKLGDYYHTISDDAGVNIAYAATFNGEQDVYFLRIPVDCNNNGLVDAEEVVNGGAPDCDQNFNPDECDPDCDLDGLVNGCDPDSDNDGVPNEQDVCDCTPPGTLVDGRGRGLGDITSNCTVDLTDYYSFRACLERSGPALPATVGCASSFDFNADGFVNLSDLASFTGVFGRPR